MIFICINIFIRPYGFSPITRHIDKREEKPMPNSVVKTIFKFSTQTHSTRCPVGMCLIRIVASTKPHVRENAF